MAGIVAAAAYVPFHRLARADITAGRGGGSGTRAVAHFDEDTTTMAVEAAGLLLSRTSARGLAALYLGTTAPAYADKTNATAVHAALGLDPSVPAADVTGGVRSGVAALRAGLATSGTALVCLSDMRSGLPGGADERDGGDAAAALLVTGADDVPLAAQLLASGSATAELLDRWALPGATASQVWDETFGEQVYVELGERALADALKACGLAAGDIDRLIVTGSNARAVRRFRATSGVADTAVAPDLTRRIGNTGAAHAGLSLAQAVEQLDEGAVVALVCLSDGADALLFRVAARQPEGGLRLPPPEEEAERRVSYTAFLTWRGVLPSEGMRRPGPKAPLAPASWRGEKWKFAFHGTRCRECGERHFPPQRVCMGCQAVDRMDEDSQRPTGGIVANSTVDRLAWSPVPPASYAIVNFDDGGRFQLDATETGGDALQLGTRVRLTFRRRYSTDGVHNYFWKVRPERGED